MNEYRFSNIVFCIYNLLQTLCITNIYEETEKDSNGERNVEGVRETDKATVRQVERKRQKKTNANQNQASTVKDNNDS